MPRGIILKYAHHDLAGKFGRSAAIEQVAVPAAQMVAKQDWNYVTGTNRVIRNAHASGTERGAEVGWVCERGAVRRHQSSVSSLTPLLACREPAQHRQAARSRASPILAMGRASCPAAGTTLSKPGTRGT